MKKTQRFTIWLLPLIVIGGLFYPLLGYLVVGLMLILIALSFFKGRYWCWHLCPRGAFLDGALSKFTLKRPLPKVFTRTWAKWLLYTLLLLLLVFRVFRSGGDLLAIGSIFVSMCLITTIIAIVLGLLTNHRSWCSICPMGSLQQSIGKKFIDKQLKK